MDKLGFTRVKLHVWLTILEIVGDCPRDSGDHSWDDGWWVTILLLVVDQPCEDVRPSFGYWLTILGILCDHHENGGGWSIHGGWLSWGWWVTNKALVGDYPLEGGWPSLGWWVTVHRMLCDIHEDGWWAFLEWLVTILRMMGDHLEDVEWSSFGSWVKIFGKVVDHILNIRWPSLWLWIYPPRDSGWVSIIGCDSITLWRGWNSNRIFSSDIWIILTETGLYYV